ncbi:hypothetical protein ACFLWG_04260 [Chloroflexota bacterium]
MTASICYRKGHEQGLWYQIQEIEKNIALKESMGKDATFEKGILKSYKKYQKAQGEPPAPVGGYVPGAESVKETKRHSKSYRCTEYKANSKGDIIQSGVNNGKRGPKHRELPDNLIEKLSAEGLGSKAIASRLAVDGIKVSSKTVQRRLQVAL